MGRGGGGGGGSFHSGGHSSGHSFSGGSRSYGGGSRSYGGSSNNFRNSTFWLRDGRYLRLKNLDFGYTLPKVLVNKLHLGNVRIYVQGTNLFFISKKFDTWDPESLPTNPRGEAYPITKSITAGLQVSL